VHRVGERRPVIPAGQVGLDCLQLRVAGIQHCPVVRIGRGKGRLLEALRKQPALVGQRPSVAAPPDPAVTQQEHAQPMAGAGAVHNHVGPGPAQVPDRFFLHGGDPDRHQLPGPVQPRQAPAVAPVGLGPCRRGPWGSARARSPGSARAGLPAAGPGHSRSGRPRSRLAASGDHQGGQRACAPTARHGECGRPRAVVVGGQNRHRDGVLVDVQPQVGQAKVRDTGHGRLLSVCGSVRAIVDDPRTCYLRNGAGRSMLTKAGGRPRRRSASGRGR